MNTRPFKFTDNEALKEAINNYFAECKKNDEPVTICGLAYALGVDRLTLLRYEKLEGNHDDIEISNTIKLAKAYVEKEVEASLLKGRNPAGYIFNLCNNFKGWYQKQTVETVEAPQKKTIFDFFKGDGIE